jgi:anti-sigma factor RsiW
MKKTYDETMLSAYIDGELDADTMDEVDLFLEKDQEAARYMLDTVRTTARLRANMNAVLQEEIPQRLLDTLSPQQIAGSRRKPVLRNLLRVAAILILGFFGFGIGILMERSTGQHFPAVIAPLPARYGDVVDAALEFNLSGKSREWRAPREAVAVKVTPVKTYRDKAGVYYREYSLEVATDAQHSQIKGLAYRTANGNWTTKVLYF